MLAQTFAAVKTLALQLAQIPDGKVPNVPKVSLTQDAVNNLASGVFFIAAAVSVIFVIIGGIRYIMSQGDAQNLTRAKNTILYSLIGLVVVVSAFVIVQIIIRTAQG